MGKKLTLVEFVNTYKEAADKCYQKYGILPECILTQAAHESGLGQYEYQFNFFGLKANKSWTGKKQLLRTWEELPNQNYKFPEIISITPIVENGITKYRYVIRDYFRAYDSAEEGFNGYCDFITENKRYKKALEVKSNAEPYLTEVAKAGYGTDSKYQKKVLDLLKAVNKILAP